MYSAMIFALYTKQSALISLIDSILHIIYNPHGKKIKTLDLSKLEVFSRYKSLKVGYAHYFLRVLASFEFKMIAFGIDQMNP
jgi:hypothetical protein